MSGTTTPLVTLISHCSREAAFIDTIIQGARRFSDLVIVCIGTRLYDGTPEDAHSIAQDIVRDRDVSQGGGAVVVAVYDVQDCDLSTPVLLHNRARQAGVATARQWFASMPFWTLMLDGDEVPDAELFTSWWTGLQGARVRSNPCVAHKMANYWVFLHPRLVAAQDPEDSVLLVHSDMLLNADALAHPRERDGIQMWHLSSPLGRRDFKMQRQVVHDEEDAAPMFWHFSWVREGGRDALKAKCSAWGHRHDCDWGALIDKAFDDLDQGGFPETDFVHGYRLSMIKELPTAMRALQSVLEPRRENI